MFFYFDRYERLFIILLFSCVIFLTMNACSSNRTSDGISSPYSYVGGSGDTDNNLEPAKDTDERLDTLEQRVAIIEGDLLQLKPSINTLMAIEGDIQDLVSELAILTNGETLPPQEPSSSLTEPSLNTQDTKESVSPKFLPSLEQKNPLNITQKQKTLPEPVFTPSKTQNETPSSSSDLDLPDSQLPESQAGPSLTQKDKEFTSTVKTVRIGKHSNTKTRVVIDLTKGSIVQNTVEQANNTIVVTLKNTTWNARSNWISKNIPLIKSYTAENQEEKAILSLETFGDDLTVKVFTLPQTEENGPRLVLDFEKGIE